MFRVGEFSRIARVTIETLRHYDAIGLFKHAKVDPFTGYRYYKADTNTSSDSGPGGRWIVARGD